MIVTDAWCTTCLKALEKQDNAYLELWQAAIEDPMLVPIMQGVYPTDKLPIVNKYPSGLIANTDPHDKPGTHWVATYFILLWESEFF